MDGPHKPEREGRDLLHLKQRGVVRKVVLGPSDFIAPRDALHGGKLFGVGEIDWQGQAVQKESGVFLPNSSTIEIWLLDIQLNVGETVTISTGVVMGHYSTKKGPAARHI